jgi:hypothetical protein
MEPKLKVKDKTEKPESDGLRARKDAQVSKALAKVIKKAAQIADLMTGDDVEDDLRVLREAKQATHRIYSKELNDLIKVPDHKTRLAATTLSRAYHEGKPVERSISVHGDADDFEKMLERFKQSPAFQQIADQDESLQKTVQGKEIPPALPEPTSNEGEQAG